MLNACTPPRHAQAFSELREQHTRLSLVGVSSLMAGVPGGLPGQEEEALTILRGQLARAEAENASLRAKVASVGGGGTCTRCVDLQLAMALNPSFRPRTAAADTDVPPPAAAPQSAAAPQQQPQGSQQHGAPAMRATPLEPPRSEDLDFLGGASAALAVLAWAPAAYIWWRLLSIFSLPLLFAFFRIALPLPGAAAASSLRRAARAAAAVYGSLATAFAAAALLLRSSFGAAIFAAIAAWGLLVDTAATSGVGRALPALRKLSLWRNLARQQQVTLLHCAELDPSRAYLVCLHPAATLGPPAFLALGTDACGFARAFPKLNVRLAAFSSTLALPLLRELLLAAGLVADSDEALAGALGRGPGSVAVAAAGEPPPAGSLDRAGFRGAKLQQGAAVRRLARCALRSGAAMVPAYAFTDGVASAAADGDGAVGRVLLAAERALGIRLPVVPGALRELRLLAADVLAERAPVWLAPPAGALQPPLPRVRVVLGPPVAIAQARLCLPPCLRHGLVLTASCGL